MIEYAGILATVSGETLSCITSFDPSLNTISIVVGVIFFVWLVVFKLN